MIKRGIEDLPYFITATLDVDFTENGIPLGAGIRRDFLK